MPFPRAHAQSISAKLSFSAPVVTEAYKIGRGAVPSLLSEAVADRSTGPSLQRRVVASGVVHVDRNNYLGFVDHLGLMTKSGVLFAVALFTAASATGQPVSQVVNSDRASQMLAAHNAERSAVGAPPLEWDETLAAHAASYGPVLASLRHLVHSPREGRPGERENLAMAWHGTLSPEQLIALWTSERDLLEPGSLLFPGKSRTGKWEDVAHYTQMVWPTTTRVGCAIYSVDWDYLICRYSPPGNKDGQPIFLSSKASFSH